MEGYSLESDVINSHTVKGRAGLERARMRSKETKEALLQGSRHEVMTWRNEDSEGAGCGLALRPS